MFDCQSGNEQHQQNARDERQCVYHGLGLFIFMLKQKIKKATKISGKKVFVGLSGGVDSAVSAYLLKKAGYKVTGVFIKTWQPDFITCTWKDDRRDAMRVASHLEIPFLTLDLEKEYKEGVADYMIAEYKKGNTPNPDIMCNKEVKFGAFMKKALLMGADFVATGHYARVVNSYELIVNSKEKKNLPTTNLTAGRAGYQLLTGIDPSKDQSYFLYTLTQDQLSKIIFPIGHLPKLEVRKIANKIGLPNSKKKDSQGICMLGDISIKDFLSHFIKSKKGEVLNKEGEVIGKHDGALFLTVGERHGFIIDKKTPEDTRMYVIAKDVLKNTITVGNKEDLMQEEGMVTKEVNLERVNWINTPPEQKKIYDAQIRYHQTLQKATLEKKDDIWTVHFKTPQTAAQGQSVVIYDKDICLGGGIIV